MTLLVSWVGVDTHGISSIYIASDSRISWGDKGTLGSFDYARKVFAFSNSPDIIGYSGDVLFPSIALGQIVALADQGLLFEKNSSCEEKFTLIVKKLNDLLSKYPKSISGLEKNSLQIIHASRNPKNNKSFFCQLISWDIKKGWFSEKINLPEKSDAVFVKGSGKEEFEENFKLYNKFSPNKDTSRVVFHCFIKTLSNIQDKQVGGAPQLVSIYRKPESSGRNIGIIYQEKRFFLGMQVDNGRNFDTIEWRNENFERCDGKGKILLNAQRQPDPPMRQQDK